MKHRPGRRAGAVLIVAAVATLAVAAAVAGTATRGPTSSHSPYVVPAHPSVDVVSLLTVGDNVPGVDGDGPGYQMVGIPDGLGAFADGGRAYGHDEDDDGDEGRGRTFTLLMNHELPAGQGIVREHGANGAFVSKWTVDRRTLRVLHGEDLIQNVIVQTGTTTLGRLCSGDLPDESAFFNRRTGRGYPGRLYLNGEEVGHEGRAFAHAMNGTSYELPSLGNMSWENAVAQPGTGDKTVVVALDDTTPGQVYVYIGQKRRFGSPVERAGLVGGDFYGIEVVGHPTEPEAGIPSGTPIRLFQIDGQEAKTGAQIEAESLSAPITEFRRPEDGSWDPERPDQFYWVTTDRPREQNGRSRLWRFNFGDLSNVGHGDVVGTIDTLLAGTEGHEMLDNMTVDRFGRVLLQEDPGNDVDPAKIWSYEIEDGSLTLLATQNQAHVEPGNTNPSYAGYATLDDETSGIIPAEFIGRGWYLLDSQIHRDTVMANQQKLVEKGQLLALYYPVRDRDEDD